MISRSTAFLASINPRLFLAKLGFSMFDTYLKIPCIKNSKRPSLPYRFIKEQPRINKIHNVAALCGKRSKGLWVLDFDFNPEQNYKNIVQFLVTKLNIIPFTVKTPSGGYHLHFQLTETVVPGNRVLARTKHKQRTIETRGEGGYIMIPPSKVEGAEYRLIKSFGRPSVPQLNDRQYKDLVAHCKSLDKYVKPAKKKSCTAQYSDDTIVVKEKKSYFKGSVKEVSRVLSEEPNGERNESLFKSAAWLFTLQKSIPGLSPNMVIEPLVVACSINGLIQDDGDDSVRSTISSAYHSARIINVKEEWELGLEKYGNIK